MIFPSRPLYRLLAGLAFTTLTAIASVEASASLVTSKSFFTAADRYVSFDSAPGSSSVLPNFSSVSSVYSSLGVRFSAESSPNTLFNTDYADSAHRFNAPLYTMRSVGGGGAATSGANYAAGPTWGGYNVSDMRIDFSVNVTAFGMYFVDNDYTTVRFSAYDAKSNLLETEYVNQVSDGGFTFRGMDLSASGKKVAYVIIDAGGLLDSTFIDDLYFRAQSSPPLPEPMPLSLLIMGLTGLFMVRRHRRP